jgi:hypothetical protein
MPSQHFISSLREHNQTGWVMTRAYGLHLGPYPVYGAGVIRNHVSGPVLMVPLRNRVRPVTLSLKDGTYSCTSYLGMYAMYEPCLRIPDLIPKADRHHWSGLCPCRACVSLERLHLQGGGFVLIALT